MNTFEIVAIVIAVLLAVAVLTGMWLRRRHAGGVLIASGHRSTNDQGRSS